MKEVASSGVITATPSMVLPSFQHKLSGAIPSVYRLPSDNRTIPVSSAITQQRGDDDIQSILSKARHPPAFYVPPTPIGGFRQLSNGETSAEVNTVTSLASASRQSYQQD